MRTQPFSVRGVIPTLITPFTSEGYIAWDVVARETVYLDSTGVDGINVGGSMSEAAGGTTQELFRLCETVRGSTRKPVIATILPDSEPEAIELLDAVLGAHVDAVLIAQPHYLFQPDSTALVKMFERLRARTEIPILLANVLASAPVDLSTMMTMVESRVVDGILQSGNPHVMVDLLRLHPVVPIFSGIEDLHVLGLLLGAVGLVSGLAAVFPADCVALYRDFHAGHYNSARERHERLLRLWRTLDHPVEQLSRVRAALAAQGRDVGVPRSPYGAIPPESWLELSRTMTREGIKIRASAGPGIS